MWLIALVACFPAWDLGDLGDDADFDGDGVPNSTDCDPNDPTFPQLRFPDLDEDGYPGSPGEERCDTAWGVPEGASDGRIGWRRNGARARPLTPVWRASGDCVPNPR